MELKHWPHSSVQVFVSLAALFLAFQTAPAGEPCHYTWIEIPNPPEFPGGTFGWVPAGRAINNHGHVTGVMQSGGDSQHGFIWSPEEGSRALPPTAGLTDIRPTDLNDHGHVVGRLSISTGSRPFYWDGKEYTVISAPGGTVFGEALSINNSGQVVGSLLRAGVGRHTAFLWQAGVLTDLGPMVGPVESVATGINERGQITGWWWEQGVGARPFMIAENGFRPLALAGGVVSAYPEGMNGRGVVVGRGLTPSTPPPQLEFGIVWQLETTSYVDSWTDSRYVVLDAINSADRAIGSIGFPGPWIPFIWHGGSVFDLRSMVTPPPSRPISFPQEINDVGQILVSRYVLSPVWLPGDLTGDCHVTMNDLAIVLADFGSVLGTFPRGDVDVDGDVDLYDLAILLTHWGE